MKTITLEEFKQIKVGDKVKIVDEVPVSPRCGWNTCMAALLGKVCTVSQISWDIGGLPDLHLAEDGREFAWTETMIEKVIPQEHPASGSLLEAMTAFKIVSGSRKLLSLKTTVKKVIYNKPATIVLWADGTKTTAKCAEGETYDPEKGLILCALKKFVKTDEIMNLLQFTKEGNGTVTYKDVLNKKKSVKKSDKTQVIDIDCTGKSTAQVKAEIQKKTKKGDK